MKTKTANTKAAEPVYWLYLHPYVYTSIKKDRAVLYNTLEPGLHEFNHPDIVSIIKRLNNRKNLYVVRLRKKEVTGEVARFISQIRKAFLGDILDASWSSGKPVQFKPVLCLPKSILSFSVFSKKSRVVTLERDTIKNFLNTLYLYINESCGLSCKGCSDRFKQFPSCTKNNRGKELTVDHIQHVLEQAKGSKLNQLNILGGNIFHHRDFFKIVELLNGETKFKIQYWTNYQNIPAEKKYLDALSGSSVKLSIDFPVKEDQLHNALKQLKDANVNAECQFIVENEKDLEWVEQAIEKYHIDTYDFSPFYNGLNTEFFRANVFTAKEDLGGGAPSMKEIMTRSIVNRFHFGNITIMPGKKVYASVNNPALGRLEEENLYHLIGKEIEKGKAWARVRKHVEPCKGCLYNELCPPITHYENAFGFNHLCTIHTPKENTVTTAKREAA